MNSSFPGLQWGSFGGGAPQTQPLQQRPAVVQQQAQAPEIDFSDGLNNAVELSLHPNVDLIGMEAAGPFMDAGAVAQFRSVITRADRPGWTQEIAGQATMNPDGGGSQTHCQMGPPNQPVLQLVEQAQANMLSGTTIQGQITPGRYAGQMNEQLQVTPGMSSLQVQGHVDGWQIAEQSQSGWRGDKTHSGNLGGVAFQRTLRQQPDGSTQFNGQIGNLPESGRIVTSPDGRTHVSRTVGPYQVEQDIWIVAGQGNNAWGGGGGFF